MRISEPDLQIKNVSKLYPNGVQALTNISLTIPSGMYGLLGPNGAGKSTLMRILATLQEPDKGSINFRGIDVVHQKEEIRKTLGFLPQEFGLYRRVNAVKLLDYFAVLKGITSKKDRSEIVETLLQQTNLWDVRKQNVDGFSGGMRQRFGVAVALIGQPKLLIVDEPTAGLDPSERVRFLNLLSELGEKSAIILSTHIVEDVSELCTRMAIINKGQILLEANPLEAVKNLQGKVWRSIIPKNELCEVEQKFQLISTKLLAGQTVVHVFSKKSPGNNFEPIEADLEDVYFSTLAGYYKQNDHNQNKQYL